MVGTRSGWLGIDCVAMALALLTAVAEGQPPALSASGDDRAASLQRRPSVLPTSQAAPSAGVADLPAVVARAADRPKLQIFQPTELVGGVGNEQILAGDVLPMVEQEVGRILQKMAPEQRQAVRASELSQVRATLLKRMLTPVIRNKLLYVDFLRDGAQNAGDKLDQQLEHIHERVDAEFEKSQVPHLMTSLKATSRAELEASLRRVGSSLKGQQQLFREQVMGMQMRQRYVTKNPQISLEQLLTRYQENIEEFQIQPKARWEQLTVLLSRFASREAAYNDLVDMGNRVFFGASFAEIAKLRSHGLNARDGGYHGWTAQGSLVSDVIDQALFSLPTNELSPILEDESGFHIIRLLERVDGGRVRFRDAQEQIKDDLQEEHRQQEWEEYLTRLRREIPVWTVFDDATQTAAKPTTPRTDPR